MGDRSLDIAARPSVRDTLADTNDADVPKLAAEWSSAEEFYGASTETLQPLVERLIRLARRARDAGEQLYCWMCL